MLFAVALSVAVWVVVTAATVAVNPAVVAPAATVTEAGTVTEELLLLSVLDGRRFEQRRNSQAEVSANGSILELHI